MLCLNFFVRVKCTNSDSATGPQQSPPLKVFDPLLVPRPCLPTWQSNESAHGWKIWSLPQLTFWLVELIDWPLRLQPTGPTTATESAKRSRTEDFGYRSLQNVLSLYHQNRYSIQQLFIVAGTD